MVVTLFISGFFAGMSAAIVLMVGNMRSEARRKRERERLKKKSEERLKWRRAARTRQEKADSSKEFDYSFSSCSILF